VPTRPWVPRIKLLGPVSPDMDLEAVSAYDPEAVTDEREESAVVVPVIDPAAEPRLLLTKRAEHLSNHPGQMSFPGGRREPDDGSLEATARREGNEEVCLDPRAVSVVGRLDDIRTVTEFSVRPFVARVPDREYTPCDDEVAETAALSIDALTDLDNYESEYRDHPHYGSIRLHYFYVDGYTVWGATARILVQFLDLATGWNLPPEPDRTVPPDADFPV
jgi:8-oxo-dGTP pyrophosphatase MutT (NUDIX family)